MFYDFEIEVLKRTQGYVDDNGDWQDGGIASIETLQCDIQPYSNGLAYKNYGYDGDVKFKIYCPPSENVELNTTIKHPNGRKYRVVMCLEWDDYSILLVSDKHDS